MTNKHWSAGTLEVACLQDGTRLLRVIVPVPKGLRRTFEVHQPGRKPRVYALRRDAVLDLIRCARPREQVTLREDDTP